MVEDAFLRKVAPFLIEMRNVPFDQQRQVLFYVVDHLPNFMAGANDARGNGQWLAEVAAQKYGAAYIHRVMLTQDWYRDNMPRYKAAFEDADLTVPKDEGVLSDHRAVQLVNGSGAAAGDGADAPPNCGWVRIWRSRAGVSSVSPRGARALERSQRASQRAPSGAARLFNWVAPTVVSRLVPVATPAPT